MVVFAICLKLNLILNSTSTLTNAANLCAFVGEAQKRKHENVECLFGSLELTTRWSLSCAAVKPLSSQLPKSVLARLLLLIAAAMAGITLYARYRGPDCDSGTTDSYSPDLRADQLAYLDEVSGRLSLVARRLPHARSVLSGGL
jgi:hypothetical protein